MNSSINIAQFSDSHLFADPNALHYGANVYQNLSLIISKIKQLNDVDLIVFTGDLSQDHSEASYQNFASIIENSHIDVPIYYVPGNHDEPELLTRFLSKPPFVSSSLIECDYWQIALLSSKSGTPSGTVQAEQLEKIGQKFSKNKYQLLMMHHHPIDVGYFIDRHGLTNQTQFWQWVSQYPTIKQVACGHVHNAMTLVKHQTDREIPVVTCPATSIQFGKSPETLSNSGLAPGFNVHQLLADGQITTSTYFLEMS